MIRYIWGSMFKRCHKFSLHTSVMYNSRPPLAYNPKTKGSGSEFRFWSQIYTG